MSSKNTPEGKGTPSSPSSPSRFSNIPIKHTGERISLGAKASFNINKEEQTIQVSMTPGMLACLTFLVEETVDNQDLTTLVEEGLEDYNVNPTAGNVLYTVARDFIDTVRLFEKEINGPDLERPLAFCTLLPNMYLKDFMLRYVGETVAVKSYGSLEVGCAEIELEEIVTILELMSEHCDGSVVKRLREALGTGH